MVRTGSFRLNLVFITIVLAFLALLFRLFYWQIIRAKDLSGQAREQYQSGVKIGASRGNILASDGNWLVGRGEAYLVFAEIPKLRQSPKAVAEKLAPLFVEDPNDRGSILLEIDRITSLLSKDEVVWVPIKQKITSDVKKGIEAQSLEGIGFEKKEDRVYPEASVAAHLLGFVGKNEAGENVGYFGLEGYYNLTLSGKSGFKASERDALGLPILTGVNREVEAISGVDLLTHIDKTIQLIVEKRLKEGIERYGAKGGTAIVFRPKDGALVSLAAFPSYDPVKYYEYGDEFFRNPAISDSFEPGSIFKPLVMAAALDTGVIEPESRCEICGGEVKVDKYTIETWDKKYHPDSTMTDVIVNSDNVGMTFVGEKLGAAKLFDYLDKFGIGHLTGIDLQGEINPGLRKKGDWNVVDLATASFGQGVATNPIQIVKAFAVLANRGVLVKPQVVDKIVKEGWEEDIKPEVGSRVISETTAREVTEMMVAAVKSGEAKWTQAAGFKIAGKTGTAQIPVSGHYDEEKTIASFVGFAPADDPKFVMLVTLREPTTSPWGSETAAPLWFGIARELFPYLGIQPER